LVLWGTNGLVGRKYDVLSVWKDRVTRVSGKALPGGHWLAEELRNRKPTFAMLACGP
jgi:haloacetate dehalogenase